MRFNYLLLSVIIAITFILSSCKHESKRSFYYWKSVFRLSAEERSYMDELQISKLYIRFFDVDLEESSQQAIPIAKIRFAEKISPRFEVVPVVYIVNRTLQKLKPQDINDLASKIYKQADIIASSNNINFEELQVDCDWTDSSHEKYFSLLESIKQHLRKKDRILSATIRLHQVKYKKITGIPPVDRGMLMYYNMGKITAGASPNSIFNTDDAAKYIEHLHDYPLSLDVALPAFSWGIHIRNNKVIELLSNMNLSDFKNNVNFTQQGEYTFSVSHSFFFRGFYFMKNDIVKFEEITPAQCNIAAKQLKSKVKEPAVSISIFHLDSLIISHYEKKDFEKVFNTFH